MSTTIKYNNEIIATATNQSKLLKTAGTYMEGDVLITDSSSVGGVYQDQDGFLVLSSDGGGDLEIAEVRFVRGTITGYVRIMVPNIQHWDYSNIDVAAESTSLAANDNEKTANVILYKGHAYAYANDGEAVLAGDNFDADNEVITGPGTITINAG